MNDNNKGKSLLPIHIDVAAKEGIGYRHITITITCMYCSPEPPYASNCFETTDVVIEFDDWYMSEETSNNLLLQEVHKYNFVTKFELYESLRHYRLYIRTS